MKKQQEQSVCSERAHLMQSCQWKREVRAGPATAGAEPHRAPAEHRAASAFAAWKKELVAADQPWMLASSWDQTIHPVSEPNWQWAAPEGSRSRVMNCAAWWDWPPWVCAGVEKCRRERSGGVTAEEAALLRVLQLNIN